MDVFRGNETYVTFVAVTEVESFDHFLQEIQRRTQQTVGTHFSIIGLAIKAQAVCGFDESKLSRAKICRWQHLNLILHSIKAKASKEAAKRRAVFRELYMASQHNPSIGAQFGPDVKGKQSRIVDQLTFEEFDVLGQTFGTSSAFCLDYLDIPLEVCTIGGSHGWRDRSLLALRVRT